VCPFFATGVIDTGGKFAASVVDTGGKFCGIGGKFAPVLLILVAYLPTV